MKQFQSAPITRYEHVKPEPHESIAKIPVPGHDRCALDAGQRHDRVVAAAGHVDGGELVRELERRPSGRHLAPDQRFELPAYGRGHDQARAGQDPLDLGDEVHPVPER